jgi:hypothetical protein
MRQIGDTLRIDPRNPVDMRDVISKMSEKNELTQEETDDISRFGKITFKLMMNRVCIDKCFSKNDNEYVNCFNTCNLKMYSIKKMYAGVAKSFVEKMDAHDKANSNPFI